MTAAAQPAARRLAVAFAAAACLLVAAPYARAACGQNGYSYAGIQGLGSVHGVAASLTPLQTPSVQSGHVAAWVGVGGTGFGPGQTDEWIEAGLSALGGGAGLLVGAAELAELPAGASYSVVVAESALARETPPF